MYSFLPISVWLKETAKCQVERLGRLPVFTSNRDCLTYSFAQWSPAKYANFPLHFGLSLCSLWQAPQPTIQLVLRRFWLSRTVNRFIFAKFGYDTRADTLFWRVDSFYESIHGKIQHIYEHKGCQICVMEVEKMEMSESSVQNLPPPCLITSSSDIAHFGCTRDITGSCLILQ